MDRVQKEEAKPSLKVLMPKVADMVAERRREWGDAHVTNCVTRGVKGEPNQFYAFEAGHVVGTPFTPDAAAMPEADLLRVAMLAGSAYMVMQAPKGK